MLKIKSCFIVMARRRWIRVYICCRLWLRRWWWYVFQNHLFLIWPAVVHFRFPLMLKIIYSVDFSILLCKNQSCQTRIQTTITALRVGSVDGLGQDTIYASDIALNIGIWWIRDIKLELGSVPPGAKNHKLVFES